MRFEVVHHLILLLHHQLPKYNTSAGWPAIPSIFARNASVHWSAAHFIPRHACDGPRRRTTCRCLSIRHNAFVVGREGLSNTTDNTVIFTPLGTCTPPRWRVFALLLQDTTTERIRKRTLDRSTTEAADYRPNSRNMDSTQCKIHDHQPQPGQSLGRSSDLHDYLRHRPGSAL